MITLDATIRRWSDADSGILEVVKMPFRISVEHVDFRLARINAPEMSTPEGPIAREFIMQEIPVGTTVKLTSVQGRQEKYRRWIVEMEYKGHDVSDMLLENGYAKPYTLRQIVREE